MSAVRQLEFFVLQYVPSLLQDKSVNIAVVLAEAGGPRFIDVRFTRDWRKVVALDPDADLEVLEALVREIQRYVHQPGTGTVWLEKAKDSFSNVIRLSEGRSCEADDPTTKLDELASAYL